ncbi:MAG: hypothetical protein HZA36_01860 [Parcubacteria group bacterium]|nr:hypothetical protein [Parcubacteria group bacterium]
MRDNAWYQFGNAIPMILLRVVIVYAVLTIIIQLPVYCLVFGLIVLFAILHLFIPRCFKINNSDH